MKKLCSFFILIFLLVNFSQRAFAQYDDTGSIQVSGTVPPSADVLSVDLSSTTTGPFAQDITIRHDIALTSSSNVPLDVILEVEWEDGTIDGELTPTVDVVEYVLNSATTGMGGATPVVDLNNNTIRWHFTGFANSTSTVSFEVRTQDTYTGDLTVTFPLTARVIDPTGVPESTVTHEYQYVTPASPTPTPTPAPTSSSTTTSATDSPSATSTPTPTSSPNVPVIIESVSIPEILTNSAVVQVITSQPTTLQLRYGSSIDNLSTIMTSSSSSKITQFRLENLTENSPYYFQIIIIDPNNAIQQGSDIYFFQTAKKGEEVFSQDSFTPNFVTARSFGGVIYSSLTSGNETHEIVATQNDILDFEINFPKKIDAKRLELNLQDNQVLGLRTYAFEDFHSSSMNLQNVSDSLYTGKLKLPNTLGKFDIVLTASTFSGEYFQQKIAEITITQPFTVINEYDQQPIEDAQIYLYRFNANNQLYELVSTQSILMNPVMTDTQGIALFSLYPDKYKAEILAEGYEKKEVEFTVSIDNSDNILPTVSLTRTSPYVLSLLNEYQGSIKLFSREYFLTLNKFADSTRFMNVMISTSILSVILTIALYLRSFRIPQTSRNQEQWQIFSQLANVGISLYLVFSVLFLISGILLSQSLPSPVFSVFILILTLLWATYKKRKILLSKHE